MDIILSAATHRSGSTLIQRIFNAHKRTLIWGEHLGCLTDFCRIRDKVSRMSLLGKNSREKYFESGENPNQWVAVMTPEISFIDEAVSSSTKTFLENLYAQKQDGHDRIGFKEVRYGERELSMLRKCYPDAKMILIVRNPIEAWKSYPKTWGEYKSALEFAKQWNRNVSWYIQMAAKDENAHLLQYEKVVSREPNTLNKLADLTKLSIPEIDRVLDRKIRGTKRKKTITNKHAITIRRVCRINMKKLGYM